MSRKSESTQIGGFEVSTTRLRPTSALKLAPKLLRVVIPAIKLAPVFRPLMQIASIEDDTARAAAVATVLGHLDVDDLVSALTELLGTLDDATLDMLYREMLVDTSITVPNDNGVLSVIELNTAQMIDIAFGGLDNGIQLLVETLLFVGKVNFERSFFAIAARVGLKKSPATKTAPA